MASLTPYNISLNSSSPTFIYQPWRDGWYGFAGDPEGGWRSSYSGNLTHWPSRAGLNNLGAGAPLRETGLDGANVTLQFEGTAVYLCLTPTGSSFTFTVDGNPISTTGSASDPACASTGAQLMAYTDGLAYGSHSASLRVNSQGNADFLFFGGVVTVGLNGTDPVVDRIDDSDLGWTYKPDNAWIYSNTSGTDAIGDYNRTRHWLCSYGPSYTASYTFSNSSAVQMLGLLNLNIGPYTIQLDGQSYIYNGSDLWRESQQVLFMKSGLDPTKQYTITLINYDTSAPNAQQPVGPDYYPCATVDGLILTKTTPIPAGALPSGPSGDSGNSGNLGTSGSSGSSSSAGAIAGGVVGGVVALCIVGALLWFFFWRRRRTQPAKIEPFEINPRPLQHGEVSPYVLPEQGYSVVPTSDGSRLDSDEPKLEGYTDTASPMSLPLTSSGSPITPRSPPRQGKGQRDAGPAVQRSPTGPRPRPAQSLSSGDQSAAANSGGDRVDIQGATTQELVTILNQRLRAEYRAENEEDLDLPDYETVR